MSLIKTLEAIHPLENAREGIDVFVKAVTQEVGNLQHALTDSETAQRIEALTLALGSMTGAAAMAILANTERAIDEVETFIEGDDDETDVDDDTLDPSAQAAVETGRAPSADPATSNAPKQPAPLPGAGAPLADSQLTQTAIPPIGGEGVNGSASTAQEPSTPAELVDSLTASHEAAKAADTAQEGATTPNTEAQADASSNNGSAVDAVVAGDDALA